MTTEEKNQKVTHVHVFGTNYPYTAGAKRLVNEDRDLHDKAYRFLGRMKRAGRCSFASLSS